MLLLIVLLVQALPLNALAAVGRELTEKELAAAYALTGLGDDATQRNAAYHKGMMPNETWNAMQVSDWLDDMLNVKLYSVQETLSQASYKLAQLMQSDPEAYAHFVNSDSYRGIAGYARDMYLDGETIREEMRYQQERINEQANIIATMKARLEDSDVAMFDSDRVRLSAQIEAAAAELKSARGEVAARAEEWQNIVEMKQETLSTAFEGRGTQEGPYGRVGDWLAELSDYGEVQKTPPIS